MPWEKRKTIKRRTTVNKTENQTLSNMNPTKKNPRVISGAQEEQANPAPYS